MTRSYLWDTAPHCPTASCYVHGMRWGYAEHHVVGCPVGGTLAASMHRLSHATNDAALTIGMALNPAIQDAAEAMHALYRSLPLRTRIGIRLGALVRRWRA